MTDAEVVLSPGEAARRLGVSPSGLRRLAVAYGEVHGELPKDSSGTSRVWSVEAVVRLQAARALLAAGQARSIKDALRAVEGGAAPPVEMMAHDGRVEAALGVVAARLEALQASNERLEVEVGELRSELAAARALPPGVNPDRIDRALEVEMRESRVETERPAAVEGGGGAADFPDEGDGAAEGSSDGPMVRAARWLEQRLRRGGRSG